MQDQKSRRFRTSRYFSLSGSHYVIHTLLTVGPFKQRVPNVEECTHSFSPSLLLLTNTHILTHFLLSTYILLSCYVYSSEEEVVASLSVALNLLYLLVLQLEVENIQDNFLVQHSGFASSYFIDNAFNLVTSLHYLVKARQLKYSVRF